MFFKLEKYREHTDIAITDTDVIDTREVLSVKITTDLDGFCSIKTYFVERSIDYILTDRGVQEFVDWLEGDDQHGIPIEYIYNTPFH